MQRNITLDYFKILLAILVIFIHMPFLFEKESIISWYLSKGFADIAVPSFFVINGYFFASKINDIKKIRKYVSHIVIVFFVWSIIYLPNYYHVVPLKYTLIMFFSGYYQLWYLSALLVGIVLLCLAKMVVKKDCIILLVAIVLYLTIRTIDRGSFPISGGLMFNGFTGFLFVSLGYYAKVKIDLSRIKNIILIPLALLTLAMYLICVNPNIEIPLKQMTVAIMLAACCTIVVITILRNSVYRQNNNYNQLLGNLSSAIFYVHVLVTTRLVPIDLENNIIHLPSVLSISICMAWLVILLKMIIR